MSGIEELSLAKHYERFAFAILDVKDKYRGMSIAQLTTETRSDIIWMLAYVVVLAGALRMTVGSPAAQSGGDDE
jgi:ABC-2 type transport system permease protein